MRISICSRWVLLPCKVDYDFPGTQIWEILGLFLTPVKRQSLILLNPAVHKQAYQTGIISRQRPLVETVQYFREIQISVLEQSLENPPGERGQRPEKDCINSSIDVLYVAFFSVLSRRDE